MLTPDLELLALDLFDIGAVKFGAFKLKLHETQPNAPLSPVYLNLRSMKHPKNPGPVTEDIYKRIGLQFERLIHQHNIEFDAVCGIPDAGDPLVGALEHGLVTTALNFDREHSWFTRRHPFIKLRQVSLKKTVAADGSRRIDHVEAPNEPERLLNNEVLVLDDVITRAGSKLEAIDALAAAGWYTDHVLVIVDRCQGGVRELKEQRNGITTHAILTLTDLIEFYAKRGLIAPDMYDRVKAYLAENSG